MQSKAPRHWPLCGDRWVPCTMASNAENFSIWWRHHDVDCQAITWTNVDPLSLRPIWTNVRIKSQQSFTKMHFEMSSAKCGSQCANHSIDTMTSSNGNIFRVTGPLCGELTGPGEFPIQRPVMRSFDVFFDLRLSKRLTGCVNNREAGDFETPSWSLWRQCNENEGVSWLGTILTPRRFSRRINTELSVITQSCNIRTGFFGDYIRNTMFII